MSLVDIEKWYDTLSHTVTLTRSGSSASASSILAWDVSCLVSPSSSSLSEGYCADEGCTQAITRWAATNAKRDAHVVAFVKDTDDIALALKYARINKPHVAIHCGGP